MILKFDRFCDVDISKLLGVYDESLDSHAISRWSAENMFLEDLRLFFSCKDVFLAVFQAADEYVSAVRVEPYQGGYLFSCLESAPKARHKGYASLLLNAVMEEHPGVYFAHIDKRNKVSMALHRKLGFSVYHDHAVYVDGSVYTSSCTMRNNRYS